MSKQTTTAKRWCFTVNNPTNEIEFDEDKMDYLIYQKEEGENKTPHYQGYVILKKASRLSALKKQIDKRGHFEVARGTPDDNIKYCSKEPRLDGPFEYGNKPAEQRGKRNDLEAFKAWVNDTPNPSYDQALELFSSVCAKYRTFVKDYLNSAYKKKSITSYEAGAPKKVFVLWGDSGTGKTWSVYEACGAQNVYKIAIGDGSKDSLWFDDYNGEEVLLLDDFYGNVRLSFMLQLLDRYPMRVQCKGGFVNVNFKTIYITSNSHPDTWYQNIDNDKVKEALRRRITNIQEFKLDNSAFETLVNMFEDTDMFTEEFDI